MMWFFRHFWIFISYHIFLLNQVEGAIAIPPSNSAPLPLFCPSVCPSVCPSIGLLTTFSGFCTFADKSLGRNGIELEMQMFPDDLPLANIDADGGYCCHFMRPSVRPTIHGLGFVYCIQSAWKKWPTIWHADVSRWLTLSIHGCLWILLLVCLSVHLSVCSFTAFSGGCAFAKEGGSHYWEMAVAITCGYGGYLLPLLAAHSSFIYFNGLVQERRNSSALEQWSYVFLALTHQFDPYILLSRDCMFRINRKCGSYLFLAQSHRSVKFWTSVAQWFTKICLIVLAINSVWFIYIRIFGDFYFRRTQSSGFRGPSQ